MPIAIKGILCSLWWSFLPLWFPALHVICATAALLWPPLYIYSVISMHVALQYSSLSCLFVLPVGVCAPLGLCDQMWQLSGQMPGLGYVHGVGGRGLGPVQDNCPGRDQAGQWGGICIPLVVISRGPLATWRVPTPLASVWKWAALPLETGIPLPEDHSSRTFGYKRSEAYE